MDSLCSAHEPSLASDYAALSDWSQPCYQGSLHNVLQEVSLTAQEENKNVEGQDKLRVSCVSVCLSVYDVAISKFTASQCDSSSGLRASPAQGLRLPQDSSAFHSGAFLPLLLP